MTRPALPLSVRDLGPLLNLGVDHGLELAGRRQGCASVGWETLVVSDSYGRRGRGQRALDRGPTLPGAQPDPDRRACVFGRRSSPSTAAT